MSRLPDIFARHLASLPTCRVCGNGLGTCRCVARHVELRDALAELAAAVVPVVTIEDVFEAGHSVPCHVIESAIARLRAAAIRAQQLLDVTRWPIELDEETP
jgi:hypothetical protein